MNIDEKMEMVMANEEVKNLSHKEKRAARPAFFCYIYLFKTLARASDVDEEGETDGEVVHLLGLLILNGTHVVGVFGV